MTLTKYGIKEYLTSGIIALILILGFLVLSKYVSINFIYPACVIFLFWCCVAAFFRDPKRKIPIEENILTSPADGTVRDIEALHATEYEALFGNNEVIRIGIFLSVFNVHLNRVPCDLKIEQILYKKGKFFDARDKKAISENESNAILCQANVTSFNFPLVVKQISGAIAKRIVCPVNIGDKFKKGDRYGMIKFGSRTELYLPKSEKITIKLSIGDKVKAGESIVAVISE